VRKKALTAKGVVATNTIAGLPRLCEIFEFDSATGIDFLVF
jgi:hypothetical protein